MLNLGPDRFIPVRIIWTGKMSAAVVNEESIKLLNAGRASEAAAGFRLAIALNTDRMESAASYFNLGIALKEQSRWLDLPWWSVTDSAHYFAVIAAHRHHDSVTAYLAALAIRPRFPQAHFNVGRAFQMLADSPSGLRNYTGRRDSLLRAAHHFRRSVRYDENGRPADSYRSLEEVLYQLGDHAAAEVTLGDEHQNNPAALNARSAVAVWPA